jgi:hypothetical protein
VFVIAFQWYFTSVQACQVRGKEVRASLGCPIGNFQYRLIWLGAAIDSTWNAFDSLIVATLRKDSLPGRQQIASLSPLSLREGDYPRKDA